MKTFTTLLIIATLFLAANSSYAQAVQDSTAVQQQELAPKPQKAKQPAINRIYYGGTVGLSFGSYTRIGLYPLVGYKITPKLSGAVKLGYEYVSDSRYTTTYTTSNYGGSLIARYRIVPAIYAHVEYETFNYQLYNYLGESTREWVPFLYLGGGFSKKMSANSWLTAQVLFDVIQDENSPYEAGAPYFSVGVGVGF